MTFREFLLNEAQGGDVYTVIPQFAKDLAKEIEKVGNKEIGSSDLTLVDFCDGMGRYDNFVDNPIKTVEASSEHESTIGVMFAATLKKYLSNGIASKRDVKEAQTKVASIVRKLGGKNLKQHDDYIDFVFKGFPVIIQFDYQ